MRRKSDRTPSKKPKPSPEKKEKVEKIKRPRTRRRKQSTTSESESAEEPVQAVQKVEVVESKIEVPPKSVKEDSPEESQEQVWHVKATETSGDVGEIKKLKICLARPSSTPERSDRSPRSKRKHSRATSSSDTQSIEGEEKKKTRHRSKRGTFESKDTLEKNQAKAIDSQADEAEAGLPAEVAVSDSTESCKETIDKETAVDETPMSTTCEDDKVETTIIKNTNETELKDNISTSKAEVQIKSSDADTTVVSPKIQVDDDEEEKELPVRRAKRLSEKKGKFEAKEKLRLEIVQEESTETGVKASSVIDKKAPSVIDEKPSSVIDEKPSSVIDEQPSSVKDENPSSVIDEKPSSVIDEKASSVIVEKAPSVIDEKASTIIEKSTSQQDEKILPESKENLLDDTVQKGSSAKEKKGKIEGEENKSSDIKKTEDVKEEIKPTEDVKEDVKKPSEGEHAPSEKEEKVASPKVKHSPIRKRSLSIEKSEILELHAEESRCESSDMCLNECQDSSSETKQVKDVIDELSSEVSINETSTEISGKTASSEDPVSTNENNVVESTKNVETEKLSNVSVVDNLYSNGKDAEVSKENHHKPLDINETPNSDQQEIQNGQATPIVTSRKRRWGSRPSRLSTQKSITISTDVLKEIIPDVKPVEFDEVIEENKPKRVELSEKFDRPVLPKIIIDNTDSVEPAKKEQRLEERDKENVKSRDTHLASARKISIVKENDSIISRPPSPPRHKQSNILYITNLVRPFTLPQLKNLLQRTGRIMENGFWIDRIKSKCFVKYETEDQATETRHALHGVTWPVSNPKTLHVDFSTEEDFNKAQENVGTENTQTSTIPGTVEDWLREQDMKREKGDMEKPWERKASMREWDMGKNEKGKEEARPDKLIREERPLEKRRHRTPERSPEPAKKFKKKEEEAPAKLLDDLFRKTKTTPCIYWLPLSAETIAVKEEQRRQHMAEHERRLQELRRNRRH